MAQFTRFPFPLLYPLGVTPLLLVGVTAAFDVLLLTNLLVAIMEGLGYAPGNTNFGVLEAASITTGD